MGSGAPTIVADGLTIRFGDLVAVDQLDLAIGEGTVYGFLGPNGAGKSTTIRLLLGLLTPTSGSASIAGHDVVTAGDAARGACGVLLDDDGLYDRLSAAQNLELFGRIAGLSRDERSSRATALLEHIGLADRATEPVASWSLGMRKKLAVARAMLAEPPVVFLDEPTNGLDPLARRALRDDIVGLARQQGTTVFVTTHDLDDAQRMCDEVGVMVEGRLLTSASPDELRRRAGSSLLSLRGAKLGSVAPALRALPQVTDVAGTDEALDVRLAQQGAPGAPVVRAAVDAGADLEEVIRADDSLEDAFVELIGGSSPGEDA
ncbi:MAG: ABC transporter ATP-binding protein [Acidimicrobiia bacterium]